MPIECPACHSELEPSNTQCTTCLRPLSRREIMRALAQQRHAQEAARLRPFRVAGTFLLIAALGYGARKAQKLGLLKRAAPKPLPTVAAPPTPPPPPPPRPMETPKPPPQAAQPPVQPLPAPKPPEPPPPADWTISGTVYDLLTLKPAAAARLTFENRSSGESFKAKTDAHGRYTIHLPKLTDGGYAVTVNAKGYHGVYLEEGSPPFSDRTRAGREDAAAEAAQSQILHVPVFLDKATSLEYNLALLRRE